MNQNIIGTPKDVTGTDFISLDNHVKRFQNEVLHITDGREDQWTRVGRVEPTRCAPDYDLLGLFCTVFIN